MNAITIHNLSPQALEKIELQAREHRTSLEDEVVDILEQAVGAAPASPDWRRRFVERIAAMTPDGVVQTDSTLLLREDRDR